MSLTEEPEVIEGTWEEISRHASRFAQRRLRVVILPEAGEAAIRQRLQALNEWLNLPRPTAAPLVDDSRAAIYPDDTDRG